MSPVEKIFHKASGLAVRRPWPVLVACLLAAAAALTLAALQLGLKTSNLDLIDRDLPPVQRFLDVANEFGTPNVLVVVFEGDDKAALRAAVDEIGPRLRGVAGVRSVVDRLPMDADAAEILKADLYFHSYTSNHSDDGDLFFIFVQPEDDESQALTIAPFVEGVRGVLEAAELDGVRAGLTGMPEYAVNDRDVIQKDISILSAVSFALVLLLFAVAFADWRRPLAAMAALAVGSAVTLGWASVVPGHLTLLSAFFGSLLFGLGVDSGIHLLDRLEEKGEDVPTAVAAIARPLVTSVLTSAAVLLGLRFCGFLGFAELGTIAGVGLVLCLASTVLVLPALLALQPEKKSAAVRERRLVVPRSPWLAALIGAAALALLFIPGPAFDTDYLNLEPRDSDAVRLEREMVRRSDHSPEMAVFTVDGRQELVDLVWELVDDEATDGGLVGTVRSILDVEVFGALPDLPPAYLEHFKSPAGRYAVYVSPRHDVWDPEHQDAFLGHMQAIDPEVTGMPVLGRFMVDRSQQALRVAAVVSLVLVVVFVLADFRRLLPAVLAVLPACLALASMNALLGLCGLAWNPLNVMALPIVLGIAVDDGVHIVHRFLAEGGDVERTLKGTGRSVVLTSATTVAAFGTLAFASHRGLASFAIALVLGVTAALVLSVVVLPQLLSFFRTRLTDGYDKSSMRSASSGRPISRRKSA